MAELILETGAAVPGANSYADVPYADEYFSSHPYYADEWAALQLKRKADLLISATRELDGLMQWGGFGVYTNQSLGFPRYGLEIGGVLFPSNLIPEQLRQATCEQALYLSRPTSNPDAPSATAGIEELRLDVIELKFGQSKAAAPVPVAALRLLRGLGGSYFNSRVRRVQVSLA